MSWKPSPTFLRVLVLLVVFSLAPATLYILYTRTGGPASGKELVFQKNLRFALMAEGAALDMAPLADWPWVKVCAVDTGITEPRWVRAIEARSGTLKGRKITHHALAYLMQDEKEVAAMLGNEADSGAGLFMEWAVNKQGELMRPNTGKLMLPGSKIRWDIHYSAGGEDITDDVELGIYFYPKGQEPKTHWEYVDPSNIAKWRSVLPQDFGNMVEVQRGMRSRGFRGALPNPEQERTVTNLHRNLARYMGTGAPRPLK